jgi:hypothetical protein
VDDPHDLTEYAAFAGLVKGFPDQFICSVSRNGSAVTRVRY